jgi:hypothetical protein
MRGERLPALLALLQVLHVAGWGAYYALTRMVYGGEPGFLLSLAAAETLPTAAGVLGGLAAERRGYRPVLLLGLLEGAFLSAAGAWLLDRPLLWLAALTASLFWSIAGPQVYALALTVSRGSAEKLGLVLAGATLGYSIGGGLAPLLATRLGPGAVLEAAGVVAAASYAVAACAASGLAPATRGGRRGDRAAAAVLVALAAAAAYVGTETLGSVYMGRLSREVGPSFYSAANAAAGLLGAAARPLAGRLLDRLGEAPLLPPLLASYAVYVVVLDKLHGLAFLAAWLLPLYPFVDTGLYRLASGLLGEPLGSAVVSSSYSMTGAVLAVAARLGLGGEALAVGGFLASAALAAVAARMGGGSSRGAGRPVGKRGAGGAPGASGPGGPARVSSLPLSAHQ